MSTFFFVQWFRNDSEASRGKLGWAILIQLIASILATISYTIALSSLSSQYKAACDAQTDPLNKDGCEASGAIIFGFVIIALYIYYIPIWLNYLYYHFVMKRFGKQFGDPTYAQ